MMNNMNMMNDMDLEKVAGGCDENFNVLRDFERLKQREEARARTEAARQEAIRREEARRAAMQQENQPTVHAHGGGASGGW